jgi:hypothetical protein
MALTSVDLPEKSGPSTVTKMPLRVAGLLCALRRRDVRLEEPLLLRASTPHRLSMPLDAKQPPLGEVRGFHSLYHPVRGTAGNDEAVGKVSYRLMVVRIDLDHPAVHDPGDVRPIPHLYFVRGLPLGCVLSVLEHAPLPLRG